MRPPSGKVHYAWIVLGAMMLALLASSGVRSSFGVFIKPLEQEFGWARTSLAAVASLSLFLLGAVGPIAGRMADRLGPRQVLVLASILVGSGALATAAVSDLWQLFLTVGILTASGAGGAAISVAASVAARWFEQRRGLVMGLAGAGIAAGQLIIIPLLMGLTLSWGWRTALLAVGAGFLLVIVPLTLWLVRNDPQDMGLLPYGATAETVIATRQEQAAGRIGMLQAARSMPFWLLAGSFWVCGYTTTGLVLTHFIPHATEHGFHAAHAAQALGVMGALNIAGTIGSGWLSDRFGPKLPLALYYGLRGLSLLFLPFVNTTVSLFAFAAIFGANYISTVPATTALTAKIYGRYSVGELSGWIFLSHQIGAAVGSITGGYLYDRTGTYTLAFYSAAVLAFLATAMVAFIRERPLDGRAVPPTGRPQVAPATGY
jgi:MFS family permease